MTRTGHPAGSAFSGAVLCGGASTRMGRDKAVLEVGGVAMARRVADALWAAGAREVVAIGGDAPALQALGLATRADDHPGSGPLAATITALSHATHDLVLVVACDLRQPDAPAMARTVEVLDQSEGALGAIPIVDGHRQWTHAAWRRAAAGPLWAAYDEGVRSLHRAAAPLALVVIEDLHPDALADADAPHHLTDS